MGLHKSTIGRQGIIRQFLVTKLLGIYLHSRAKEEEEKEGKNPRKKRCEDWMQVLTHS